MSPKNIDFEIVHCSSEEDEGSILELLNPGPSCRGWASAKYCIYPQVNILKQLSTVSESCDLVGNEDGSRLKGRGFEPRHRCTRWKWCQSHTSLINTSSLVLPRYFKWLLTNRVLGCKKKYQGFKFNLEKKNVLVPGVDYFWSEGGAEVKN